MMESLLLGFQTAAQLQTVFLRCSVAHIGIHEELSGHLRVAFVFTLFTFLFPMKVRLKSQT